LGVEKLTLVVSEEKKVRLRPKTIPGQGERLIIAVSEIRSWKVKVTHQLPSLRKSEC
jgi:hypothetical protein